MGITHVVDCHRRHRGPYTGAGELLRTIVPGAYESARALVLRHALTLLSIAPELDEVIPISPELARSFEFSREGKSRFFTLRLANGVVDFLKAHFALDSGGVIVFENVHAADTLDQELIAVLLRRAAPEKILVSVGTSTHDLPEPLLSALRARAQLTALDPREVSPMPDSPANLSTSEHLSLARAYVASDCTSDDLMARRAYELLDPTERRTLHLARVSSLEALKERSLTLGAIPFHWERAASQVEPFVAASAYCMQMGYYDACLDLSRRGSSLIENGVEHGDFGRNILFSLLLLERFDEVERYCREVEALPHGPALRSHCAYAMAILNARLYPNERRDYDAARAWVSKAILLADLVPESETKVVNLVFLHNTLALIELRTGDPERARQLLSDGLIRLRREAPSKYAMECIILFHNRARIHVLLGHHERALEDYTTLLEHQPSNSDAHFDRGIIYQGLGRMREALLDYDAAIVWSPPYDEAYFNRAQVLSALGRKTEALADYGHVLELEPKHIVALVNRAAILFERGELAAAREDIARALTLSPRHAKALCLLGLLEMSARQPAEARRAFDLAIESDDSEATAWINRATLHFQGGQLEAALRDLDRALELGEDAIALHNRRLVLRSLKR